LSVTLSDGIYVDTENLRPRLQNQIRRLAAFSNPVFYKNQRMGLSNFSNARFIYLGSDIDGYIKLPRGIYEPLMEHCDEAGIPCSVDDQRCSGSSIRVSFQGKLKDNQEGAVEELLRHDNGILNAATAFGKTVVCCRVIAERKVRTLILLESSALIEQWEKALEKFLVIDEEMPEYRTPSGRIRKRKSLIGVLQNAHDSTGGIVDIAMVGSIRKKGELHERFKSYGMVLLDECQHAPSGTIADILQESNARYVYGVTATPMRGDQLERITYMLIGPVRFRYTSKDRAKEQGIAHLVYPRFTHAVIPRFSQDHMHPNAAYEILRNNEDRDELIINDTVNCIVKGRTPVILTRYLDHARKLYEKLRNEASNVFLLTGDEAKKERREILDRMEKVPRDESMLLIATGKLIGEGFDYPRLDTLIMAMPVSFKSVVEQYAGRLNRDYEGKKDVIIYDYVDSHISIFERMYAKRLKAYKQIGYSIFAESAATDDATKNDEQPGVIL
jgi:superfamily II DNA or RNA helicase